MRIGSMLAEEERRRNEIRYNGGLIGAIRLIQHSFTVCFTIFCFCMRLFASMYCDITDFSGGFLAMQSCLADEAGLVDE